MNMVMNVGKLRCDRLQNDCTVSWDKYYLFSVECLQCRSRGQPLLLTVFSLEKSLFTGQVEVKAEIMLTKLCGLKHNVFCRYGGAEWFECCCSCKRRHHC